MQILMMYVFCSCALTRVCSPPLSTLCPHSHVPPLPPPRDVILNNTSVYPDNLPGAYLRVGDSLYLQWWVGVWGGGDSILPIEPLDSR